MPRKSTETESVGWVGIVETWILSFDTVDRAIEASSFLSDFGDEILLNMYPKGGGFGRHGMWKETNEEKKLHIRFVHC